MCGLVPGIHAAQLGRCLLIDVDGRDKPGHDGRWTATYEIRPVFPLKEDMDMSDDSKAQNHELNKELESYKYNLNISLERYKYILNKNIEMHKHINEYKRINVRGVIDFALSALRSIIIVNGAAVIALLTFIGNKKPDNSIVSSAFSYPIRAFAVGVGLGLVATGLAYLSQLRLTYTKPSNKRGEATSALILRLLAIITAILGVVAFFCGTWKASAAFS
jgi:hypothetical protein